MEKMLGTASQLSVTLMVVIFSLVLWSLEYRPIGAIKIYSMEEECGQEISMIVDNVFQGKLLLKPGTTSLETCVVTIESWYSMPNLMFHITDLGLSCTDGYVEFSDGRTDGQNVSGLEGRVCNPIREEIRQQTFLTQSQFLRVKYTRVNPNIQTDVQMFSLTFTAYFIGACRNDQFKCSNGRCIHEDLKCNGHNSCGDNSDCKHELSSVTTAGIVAASLVGVCILATIVAMVIYHCYCKKNHQNGTSNNRTIYNNTRSIGHHDNTLTWHSNGTLSIVSGQQPAYPRNWSYTGHQAYNPASQTPINLNTNIHCWFVADRNQAGTSNTDNGHVDSDDDLDNNWTKDEHVDNSANDKEVRARYIERVDNSANDKDVRARYIEHVDNSANDKVVRARDNEGKLDISGEESDVYIEDEVIPDSEVDKGSLTIATHESRTKNGKEKKDGEDSVYRNSRDVENWNEVDDEPTIDESDITIRKARNNTDADEIDESFADFYRDLLPGNYYNYGFSLDESRAETSSRKDNSKEKQGELRLSDSFDSFPFSTDL